MRPGAGLLRRCRPVAPATLSPSLSHGLELHSPSPSERMARARGYLRCRSFSAFAEASGEEERAISAGQEQQQSPANKVGERDALHKSDAQQGTCGEPSPETESVPPSSSAASNRRIAVTGVRSTFMGIAAARKRGEVIDASTYATAMGLAGTSGHWHEVLLIAENMRLRGMSLADKELRFSLKAAARVGDMDTAHALARVLTSRAKTENDLRAMADVVHILSDSEPWSRLHDRMKELFASGMLPTGLQGGAAIFSALRSSDVEGAVRILQTCTSLSPPDHLPRAAPLAILSECCNIGSRWRPTLGIVTLRTILCLYDPGGIPQSVCANFISRCVEEKEWKTIIEALDMFVNSSSSIKLVNSVCDQILEEAGMDRQVEVGLSMCRYLTHFSDTYGTRRHVLGRWTEAAGRTTPSSEFLSLLRSFPLESRKFVGVPLLKSLTQPKLLSLKGEKEDGLRWDIALQLVHEMNNCAEKVESVRPVSVPMYGYVLRMLIISGEYERGKGLVRMLRGDARYDIEALVSGLMRDLLRLKRYKIIVDLFEEEGRAHDGSAPEWSWLQYNEVSLAVSICYAEKGRAAQSLRLLEAVHASGSSLAFLGGTKNKEIEQLPPELCLRACIQVDDCDLVHRACHLLLAAKGVTDEERTPPLRLALDFFRRKGDWRSACSIVCAPGACWQPQDIAIAAAGLVKAGRSKELIELEATMALAIKSGTMTSNGPVEHKVGGWVQNAVKQTDVDTQGP